MVYNQLRTCFVVVASLQLVVALERQVFDFLGYMWIPIMLNFLNILMIIFGVFGTLQNIKKYMCVYIIWCLSYTVWNLFLICFYANVGLLNRENTFLSLDTGGVSWWESNGFGCHPLWLDSDTSGVTWTRPAKVEGCLLKWYQVEMAQTILTLLLFLISLPIASKIYLNQETNKPVSKTDTIRRANTTANKIESTMVFDSCSPKPMTPRRVKRRSGTRSSTSRRSRRSYRNAAFVASTGTISRPTSARSSYSNFHGARSITQSEQNVMQPSVSQKEFTHNTNMRSSLSRSAESVKNYRDDASRSQGTITFCVAEHPYGKSNSQASCYESIQMTNFYRNYNGPNYANNMVYGMEEPLPAYGQPETTSYMAQATPQAPGPPAYNMPMPDNDYS